jgi:hypothetical protein
MTCTRVRHQSCKLDFILWQQRVNEITIINRTDPTPILTYLCNIIYQLNYEAINKLMLVLVLKIEYTDRFESLSKLYKLYSPLDINEFMNIQKIGRVFFCKKMEVKL